MNEKNIKNRYTPNEYEIAWKKICNWVYENEKLTIDEFNDMNGSTGMCIQKLVDKTIAKDVIEKKTQSILPQYFCPSCGRQMKNYSFKIPYCEHCGQKLRYQKRKE